MTKRIAALLLVPALATSLARADSPPTISSEVIEIHDLPPPLSQLSVKPKPLQDPRVLPPYSDEAIVRDVWTRAWFLLDVDATGAVVRAKFLKRPGAKLEDIALAQAFKVKFEPARDLSHRPSRSYAVWMIEWPSWQWMVARTGNVTRLPVRYARHVPCRGSGPLNLNSVHPVYRDCSVPDPAKLDPNERWLARGAS